MWRQRSNEISQSRTVDCLDLASYTLNLVALILTRDLVGSRVTEKPRFSLTGDQSSHETKELGDVKRQLLSQPDWAAVSATRPLEIAFTPVEEIERFGKRRKLNDNDRRRLTANPYGASNFFGPPESHRRKRNPSSVIDSIENIHIEIDGQRVAQSKDSSEVVMTMSSQSMLLDDQDSPLVEQDMEKENLTAAWITSLFPR